jgi:glycerol kinase
MVARWRKMINTAAEIETLAASVPDNGGVYFPATGLGAPLGPICERRNSGYYKRNDKRTFSTCDPRDCLSSIRLQNQWKLILEKRKELVDGGAAVNNLMMQFQSDLFGSKNDQNARNDSTRRSFT